MLISLTVGKVDAGVAVLLTEDKRLIEFPSILLPPSISSGSIVDITVSRNHTKEDTEQKAFSTLQNDIYTTYGVQSPSTPILRCRNATQTSVVLEWDPINLATAQLRSLSLYRNGSKAGSIPRPLEVTSTKISGLAIDMEYVFHLILRTSAGVYNSEKLSVRTHKMTDLTGITVTPGQLPPQLKFSLSSAVERIGGKLVETVRIDTTHFVCTEGRGREWERALEMNIPVVRPEWVEGCEREGRIVGVRGYYLNADPRLRQVGPGVAQGQRRTDSQTNIQRVTPSIAEGRRESQGLPTSRTDDSTISPQVNSNGQSAKMETMREPPTPPAKDNPSPKPSTSPAPPQSEVTDSGSEDAGDEKDAHEQKSHQPRPAFQPRDLVQSPFETTHKTPTAVPLQVGDKNGSEEKNIKRKISDGGSFEEVGL